MTLQSVDDKTGVPISTLRRIVTLKGNPQPETVIKIFIALGFDNELAQYMKTFHPDIANLMTANSHNQERSYIATNEVQYFTDESSFLIMTMAYTSNGTTEAEIKQELGLQGVAKLNELVSKGLILRKDDGRLVGKSEKYKLSFKDTLKRIEHSLKYYRLSEAGEFNNFLNYQTESLNLDGIKTLKALEQKQAIERREQVFNNQSLHGNYKIFIATISSTFVAQSSGKGVLQ